MQKYPLLLILVCCFVSWLPADNISESQQRFINKYKNQKDKVAPEEALINTDSEPAITSDFVDLYNGKDLEGWTIYGGEMIYQPLPSKIVGKVVKGEKSAYLTTDGGNYTNFILTAELYWAENSNSGIMVRAKLRDGEGENKVVYGTQVEMEGFPSNNRGWSGGIYGQSAGGWYYPLWLDAHAEVRKALKKDEWNRVTISCNGPTIKTWVNGIPAAHYETQEYLEGHISLQVHSGSGGEVHFRKIKIKELNDSFVDLFESGDFSAWTRFDGKPVSSGWTIRDGVVFRGGLKPGAIVTKNKYSDFELRFEWAVSSSGNSGIKYRVIPEKRLGLEYQILDDERHRDRKNPTHRTASLYDLYAAPDGKSYRPAGEWNNGRIVAKGNHIEHWLNGEKVVIAEIGSVDWNEKFVASKYHKNEGFGTWTGPILLQDHLDEVWYRNVLIRKL
ncbi:MAG: DUF1080 domain-containing protein [Verrucomicrobiota bacterium]